MAVSRPHHRFTVDEYERMVEAGILTEDDRVELLGGEIVEMSPIGGRHMGRLNRLTHILHRLVGDEVIVSVQNPIRLADDSEPEPDIALLRRTMPDDSVPTAADALLVIEIADTSLAYDRDVKLPLYAAAGIAEAWLVDLSARTIEQHREPRAGHYRLIALATPGDTLDSTVLPSLVIPVDAIFA